MHINVEGDTYLEPFGDEWMEIEKEEHDGEPSFSIITLERA